METELLITIFGLGWAIMVNSIALIAVSRRVSKLENYDNQFLQ